MAAEKKSGGSGAAPQKEMLLVGSKTKAALKDLGVNVAGDALAFRDALTGLCNRLVLEDRLGQAAARAEANGRKTVRGHDFLTDC